MARRRKPQLSDGARESLVSFEECLGFHNSFVTRFRRRHDAYRGILEVQSKAADWTSKVHPPYVNHIVETSMASLLDDRLSFRIKPRPKMYEPGEAETALRGARAHEILHAYQFARDRFSEKQRLFALQNAIAGITAAKTYWKTETVRRSRLEVVDVGAREMGMPGVLYDLEEVESIERRFDGPCTEICNIEDFFWHESAVELQRSPLIAHRVWMSFPELKQAEKQGYYSNVDELKDVRGPSAYDDGLADQNNKVRTKDMIEVLEVWRLSEDGIRVVTLGDRAVELRSDRANPFWHGEYPFVVCATQPDLFSLSGMSQVEKIAHLQEAIWDFLNQTHDNVRLLNNFIVAVNTQMVDDVDAFEHEPGARWPVEGPIGEALQVFTPPTMTAEVALPHIRMLQVDMQNLAGGTPFTTTSETSRIGASTATEAALVTQISQKVTLDARRQLNYAYERIGQQRLELNQQFIRRPVMVEQIGLDEASEFAEIAPQLLQGDFDFDISPMQESLMRSERRAEANALFQAFIQAAPVLSALAAGGMGTPLNPDAFVKRLLEGYDEDPSTFFSAKKPPLAPQADGGDGSRKAPPLSPQTGGGVTAPEATNPVTSPSNQSSISPEVMMQRILAQRGGVSNVGG